MHARGTTRERDSGRSENGPHDVKKSIIPM
jgi:hypothetical protein